MHASESWGVGDPEGPEDEYRLLSQAEALAELHQLLARNVAV